MTRNDLNPELFDDVSPGGAIGVLEM